MKIDVSSYTPQNKGTLKKKAEQNISVFNSTLFKRFTDKQKEAFYREFSILIKSGVDFNQALTILSEQESSKYLQSMLTEINEQVVKGKSLYNTIKEYKQFSPYEYYSIKIGEETKKLPEVLDQLQMFFSRKIRMKRQVISVITYPAFIFAVTLGVLYFMLNYVVPMFSKVFSQFGSDLPEITKFVIKLSSKFNMFSLIFIGVLILIFTIHYFKKNDNTYNSILSKIVLKVPYIGNFIKKIYIARFCQSMSLLLSARTPLVTSLELTERMLSFYPIKQELNSARRDILKGGLLSSGLGKNKFFPKKILSMVTIGEQVNELDLMFDKLSEQLNDEIDHSIKMIGTVLEPLMIIMIGSIVGFIMVAMYSPIFNLSKVIGS